MSDEAKSVRLPIMVTPTEAKEIDDWRSMRRVSSRAEAIRMLMRAGMDLPGLCIDLLDALELSDLLKHSGIAKEVESLEAYLGTAPLVDIEHVFPKNAGDNVENLIMLTRREHQVVGLIGQGVRNKEIAEQLGISESTAKWYVGSILEKLGLSNRDELLTTSHRSAVEDRRKGDDQ